MKRLPAFHDAPIRRKLTALSIVTTALALLIAGAAAIGLARSTARDALLEKVSTTAGLLGENTSAALTFREFRSAERTLVALKADPEIVGATIYALDGAVFARYADGSTAEGHAYMPPAARPAGYRFSGDMLDVFREVLVGGERIGTIHVRASLQKTRERTWRYAGLCVLVFVGVAVFASWLSAGPLRAITSPISMLSEVVARVARERDYGVRARKESEDELGRLIDGFNDMLSQIQARDQELARVHEQLEARVEDRTRALMQSNRELAAEMKRRAAMEIELRQAQKLEAVGRLAAGVAHEINTPVQFVNDSCYFLRDGLKDLQGLLCRYRETVEAVAQGQVGAESAMTQLRQAEHQADLPYLLENMPGAVERSLDGLQRVTTIVRSMKEFAHPDQKQKADADLNRAIECTLTIARNEYKYVADVVTDFGELPPVCCFLSDLNQAVLNIVVNAAHAIGDAVRGTDRRGVITVRTRRDGDRVLIAVQDTGTGIPDSIRDKIFDPFFTTKEVGKGTGQGLAIVRSVVVDKHQGSVAVDTAVGVGSTFTLRIPIGAAHLAAASAA
ncbi:MAG: HAMP domain-containing protein [Gammaproteobacteria bacterium]|nr:HAMP domain-containing protein [Gammaproteobacteria bacterium]